MNVHRNPLRLILAAILLVAPGVGAATTLDVLFSGQSLTVGDKLFTNWTLNSDATVGDGIVYLPGIDVTGLPGDPLNPGLKYTALGLGPNPDLIDIGTAFGHHGPASATLDFSFTVSTLSGDPLIEDNSLLLDGFVFDDNPGSASISIVETVTDGANTLGTKSVSATDTTSPGDPSTSDAVSFAPQSSIQVRTRISIDGPLTNDGVRLTSFQQHFSQVSSSVPEPATAHALALGLAGLGLGWLVRRAPSSGKGPGQGHPGEGVKVGVTGAGGKPVHQAG